MCHAKHVKQVRYGIDIPPLMPSLRQLLLQKFWWSWWTRSLGAPENRGAKNVSLWKILDNLFYLLLRLKIFLNLFKLI
jgi:hypothetical protein